MFFFTFESKRFQTLTANDTFNVIVLYSLQVESVAIYNLLDYSSSCNSSSGSVYVGQQKPSEPSG